MAIMTAISGVAASSRDLVAGLRALRSEACCMIVAYRGLSSSHSCCMAFGCFSGIGFVHSRLRGHVLRFPTSPTGPRLRQLPHLRDFVSVWSPSASCSQARLPLKGAVCFRSLISSSCRGLRPAASACCCPSAACCRRDVVLNLRDAHASTTLPCARSPKSNCCPSGSPVGSAESMTRFVYTVRSNQDIWRSIACLLTHTCSPALYLASVPARQ